METVMQNDDHEDHEIIMQKLNVFEELVRKVIEQNENILEKLGEKT